MSKLVAVTGFALLLSGGAAAGSFDGPYAQLGFGLANNQNKVQHTGTDSGGWNENWQSMSTNNVAGQVALGYSYNPVSIFNIAANVYYNITSQDSGQYTYSQPGWNYAINSKLKNVWGISIEPGAYLADKTLGYVKLGWANASSSASVTDRATQVGGSATVNGFLYGAGIKQLLTNNLYVGVEFSQSLFNQGSSTYTSPAGAPDTETIKTKPMQTMGLVTLGYKF